MKETSIALALAGLGAGVLAAWYWYCTSAVSTTPTWARGENAFEPVDREQAHAGEVAGLVQAANESARLNKIAALWTGASIFLSALSVVVGAFVR
jgi:hypothetical protein